MFFFFFFFFCFFFFFFVVVCFFFFFFCELWVNFHVNFIYPFFKTENLTMCALVRFKGDPGVLPHFFNV